MVEKESIPAAMDLIGVYEARLGDSGELLEYSRKGLRRRADVGAAEI